MQNHLLSFVLLGIALSSPSPAWADPLQPEPRDSWWLERHEGFVREARSRKIPVLLLGDSITDGWRGFGFGVWGQQLAPLGAANFGIGGDRIEHVLWRIQNGELDGVPPKVIVLLIGTNNLPDDSIDQIRAGHANLVREIRARAPLVKILLFGIFPRVDDWSAPFRDKIGPVNRALKSLADETSVFYRDIGHVFLERDGSLSRNVMYDGLHLTSLGYFYWAYAMVPVLTELLPRPPVTNGPRRSGK